MGVGLRMGGLLENFCSLFCFQQGKNYSMSLLLKSTLLFVNKHAKSLKN